jgi:hypothetical protein
MVRTRKIKNRGADHDQLLVVSINESTAQRVITFFDNYSLAKPLPKLLLSRPVRFPILAEDESIIFLLLCFALFLFLLFFNFFFAHMYSQDKSSPGNRSLLIPTTQKREISSGDRDYLCLRSAQMRTVTAVSVSIAVAVAVRDLNQLFVISVDHEFEPTIYL